MLMTSGPSGSAALKPTWFGGGYYYMVWGTLRPDTVYHFIYKCKLRLYHAKEKPMKNQQHAETLSGFHLIRDGAECPLASRVHIPDVFEITHLLTPSYSLCREQG